MLTFWKIKDYNYLLTLKEHKAKTYLQDLQHLN